ncbi:MAG: helicase-associated domain-containing protein [Pseudonocardia sp.]|nr:helicase-associated domain-containing protein [Pseudonocardia sp.]
MPATSLLDWLRARDDASLVTLLRLRPDLGVPPPADFHVLATRIGNPTSINRACDDLDTVALAVLEALVASGAASEPVPYHTLVALFGARLAAAKLPAALDTLRARALVWDDGDGDDKSRSPEEEGEEPRLCIAPAAAEVVSQYPCGLGRGCAALADKARLDALLADTQPNERRVLEALAHDSPIGRSQNNSVANGQSGPVQRLVSRGLLVRIDSETVELPREVGLALRGPAPLARLVTEEPSLPIVEHGANRIDGTAAGAVLELLRRVGVLLEAWSAEPPPVLRTGGLGVRELRRASRELGLEPAEAALLIEVVVAAGLVVNSASGRTTASKTQWIPTTQADLWLAGGPEQRWVQLAKAWLDLPRLPGLIGQRNGDDPAERFASPLSDELRRPLAPLDRRRVLDVLAGLPHGQAVAGPDELAAVLAWRAPRHGGRLRDALVVWTVAEATFLGVVALGGLASHGRALLGSAESGPVINALRAVLPEPVDHVLLQADLTAIAPGRLRADVAEELALVAEVESTGEATVYRVTESSLRRALDTGQAATDLHELFARRSATAVPQGLTYLIDDMARRHGRLRGGRARSFLRADDEVLLTEVLAHPSAQDMKLRRIAPTVLVSELVLTELMDRLRAAGFSPAAEAGDGSVLDLRPPGRRVPARPRQPERSILAVPDQAQLVALVAGLRAGDHAAALRPWATTGDHAGDARGSHIGSDTAQMLRDAARQRQAVWIGYVNSQGVSSRRIIEPVKVGGGVLEGWEHGADRTGGTMRRFKLHRITSAAVVERIARDEDEVEQLLPDEAPQMERLRR